MNECYNVVVVVVKAATAVVWTSATILLLLWKWRLAISDRALVLGGVGSRKTKSRSRPRRDFLVSDLDSAETFQISRNLGLDIDENVCLLDSQLWAEVAVYSPDFVEARVFTYTDFMVKVVGVAGLCGR
jgi:hypothetical protein